MRRAGGVVVAVGCVYEVAALTTNKIPTISKLCWKLRDRHPVGAAIIWSGLGVLAWHLLIDENSAK